jgi:transcription elongation factor
MNNELILQIMENQCVTQLRRILTGLLASLAVSTAVHAEPTTAPHSIVYIRPYLNSGSANSGMVYFQIEAADLCATNTYGIDLTWGGSKQLVAVLMLAQAQNKRVQIEIDNAGCGTPAWNTKVQSIYLTQ